MEEERLTELIAAALMALDVAFVRLPRNNKFGAAVLTTNGNIYRAGNYFSSTFSLSIHAEVAALVHAAAHGDPYITAIAIVSTEDPHGKALCHPCGSCRQLIFENARISKLPIDVVMSSYSGQYEVREIRELVPYPWPQRAPSTDV